MSLKGKVVRLHEKGFGFIKAEDGHEYFFHASAVKNGQWDAVQKGSDVEIDDLDETEKGKRTERVFLQS